MNEVPTVFSGTKYHPDWLTNGRVDGPAPETPDQVFNAWASELAVHLFEREGFSASFALRSAVAQLYGIGVIAWYVLSAEYHEHVRQVGIRAVAREDIRKMEHGAIG